MNPATAPASRNCHQELWRNPNVAEIRPSDPRDGEGRSTVTQPPSEVGTAAYVIRPVTPQCGTPSSNVGTWRPRSVPWMVTFPSALRVTIIVLRGM